MFKLIKAAVLASALWTAGLSAQESDRTVRSSNGVQVKVHGDDFAGRYEYSAPAINIEGGGYALIARIVEPGRSRNDAFVLGSVVYRGEWRRYDRALLRGGQEVKAVFGDRDVVSCSGSRYGSGCTLREGFQLEFTEEQMQAARAAGQLDVQLRAGGISPVMISLPIRYFDAVNEAADGRQAPATSAPEPTVSAPSQTAGRLTGGVVCTTCDP